MTLLPLLLLSLCALVGADALTLQHGPNAVPPAGGSHAAAAAPVAGAGGSVLSASPAALSAALAALPPAPAPVASTESPSSAATRQAIAASEVHKTLAVAEVLEATAEAQAQLQEAGGTSTTEEEEDETLKALDKEQAQLDAQLAEANRAEEAEEKAAAEREHAAHEHSTHEVHAIATHPNGEAKTAEQQHGPTPTKTKEVPAPGSPAALRESARSLLRKLAQERVAAAKQAVKAALARQHKQHRFVQQHADAVVAASSSPDFDPVAPVKPFAIDHSRDDEIDDDQGRNAHLLKFAMDQMAHAASRNSKSEIAELLEALKKQSVLEASEAAAKNAAAPPPAPAAVATTDAIVATATNYTIWILLGIIFLVLCVAVPLVWMLWLRQIAASPPDGRYSSASGRGKSQRGGHAGPYFNTKGSLNAGGSGSIPEGHESDDVHEPLVLDEDYVSSDEERGHHGHGHARPAVDGLRAAAAGSDEEQEEEAWRSHRKKASSGSSRTNGSIHGRSGGGGGGKKKSSRSSASSAAGGSSSSQQVARPIPVTAAIVHAAATLDAHEEDEDLLAQRALLTAGLNRT